MQICRSAVQLLHSRFASLYSHMQKARICIDRHLCDYLSPNAPYLEFYLVMKINSYKPCVPFMGHRQTV